MDIRSPHINWLEPAEERDFARHISFSLTRAAALVSQFEHAVALNNHCGDLRAEHYAANGMHGSEVRRRYAEWQAIAARDAAFTIYHFQSTARSIRDQLAYAPTLKAKVDTKALEEAWLRIDRDFPFWKEMRDAVGHSADIQFSPAEIDKHRPASGPGMIGTLDKTGTRLISMRKKRIVYLDVTPETLETLKSVVIDVFLAFRKADLQHQPA